LGQKHAGQEAPVLAALRDIRYDIIFARPQNCVAPRGDRSQRKRGAPGTTAQNSDAGIRRKHGHRSIGSGCVGKDEMVWWIGNGDLNLIMRRLAILAALAAITLLGAAARAPHYPGTYSESEAADLDKLSAYLNSIRTLKSNFVQLGPEGDLAQGEFDLSRPGKLRFSYNPPSPILIVAAGGDIYVKNSRLNTVDRTSLSDTPLDILLNQNVDLRHNTAVTGVEEQQGALIVHARANTTRSQSN